ncbi:hypothetical protein [Lactococcus sp.]|uniref:hypothetical protein n=1 Tax=Lactococcus sp. TaxID=44273 RepID=UPI002FCBFA5D
MDWKELSNKYDKYTDFSVFRNIAAQEEIHNSFHSYNGEEDVYCGIWDENTKSNIFFSETKIYLIDSNGNKSVIDYKDISNVQGAGYKLQIYCGNNVLVYSSDTILKPLSGFESLKIELIDFILAKRDIMELKKETTKSSKKNQEMKEDLPLNKLKIYLSQEYPKGSWFTKSDLKFVADINAYCIAQGYADVYEVLEVLVSEKFLTKDYRFGKYLYEINSSKTTEKDNKIVEKSKNNLRNQKTQSNEIVAHDIKKKKNVAQVSRNQKSVSNEIVAHDFEKKKQQLQKFAKTLPNASNLPTVPTSGGLFGWFDYNVTGNDLNELTRNIENKWIAQNKELVRVIKEFDTIYETFDELDKGYIQAIIASLKSAEEAARKASKGLDGVKENSRQLEKDQKDIKTIIDSQKIAVKAVLSFKEKLAKIEHILDVDQLFSDVDKLNNELSSFQKEIEQSNQEAKAFVNQKLSLVENTAEKIQSSLQDKITSIITNQASENSDIRKLIHKNTQKTDASLNDLSQKVASNNDEMKSVNQSISVLQQQLKISRIVAVGIFSVLVILMILILSGVLG